MKLLFTLLVACCAYTCFAQAPKPKPSPKPSPAAESVPTPTTTQPANKAAPDESAFEIELKASKFMTARLGIKLCSLVPDDEKCKDINEEYRSALSAILKSEAAMNSVLIRLAKEYEATRGGARSAPQVSQVADEFNTDMLRIIAAQNQAIIELLTKLVNKK